MARIYDTFGRKFGSQRDARPPILDFEVRSLSEVYNIHPKYQTSDSCDLFQDENYPKRGTLRKKLVSLTLKKKSKITKVRIFYTT